MYLCDIYYILYIHTPYIFKIYIVMFTLKMQNGILHSNHNTECNGAFFLRVIVSRRRWVPVPYLPTPCSQTGGGSVLLPLPARLQLPVVAGEVPDGVQQVPRHDEEDEPRLQSCIRRPGGGGGYKMMGTPMQPPKKGSQHFALETCVLFRMFFVDLV